MEINEIQGQIKHVKFYNKENGYAILNIALMSSSDKQRQTTAVGKLFDPRQGQIYTFFGKKTVHATYGEQFVFDSYVEVTPADEKGLIAFLSSGLFAGIGEATAKNIVKTFGLETVQTLDTNPERLAQVKGIRKNKIPLIIEAWNTQKTMRQFHIFMQGYGISLALSKKVYTYFNSKNIDPIVGVQNNPYELSIKVPGIGFITADLIGKKLGIDNTDLRRIEGAVYYELTKALENGHTCLPYAELIEKTRSSLDFEGVSIIVDALSNLIEHRNIVIDNRFCYMPFYHKCETGVVTNFQRIFSGPMYLKNSKIAYQKALVKTSYKLADMQEQAIQTALKSKIFILTGGPGTGKTTITKCIIHAFQSEKLRIFLAAPTGRAAKKMSEVCDMPAKTIHRLLEYTTDEKGKTQFAKNGESPLECDVLIVDEASMIDISLMYHLSEAIPTHCAVIFIGDVNQLPSVGAGNVLRGMIESEAFPTVRLNQIFRQDAQSGIVVSAHAINKGEMPVGKGYKDFLMVPTLSQEESLENILTLIRNIPKKMGIPFDDIQVLSPMYKNFTGVDNLNEQIREIVNPLPLGINLENKQFIYGNKTFRINDRVMQTKNNYDKNVFNGDIGKVIKVSPGDKVITVMFDQATEYQAKDLNELTLAYAITVHKSQGSEYPCVIMPVTMSHYIMLQRNLVYTGITRGKKLVVTVGEQKAMTIAVKNNKVEVRHSQLAQKLVCTEPQALLVEAEKSELELGAC